MAFTAKLGDLLSRLANIILGMGSTPTQHGDATITAPLPSFSGVGVNQAPFHKLVQSTTATTGASASFPSPVTPGNLIVVYGGINGPAGMDNQGNTYHQAAQSGGSKPVGIWYAWNVTASGTFTITPTQVGDNGWIAEEWDGFGTVDPLDLHAAQNGLGGAPVTITAGVPSRDHGVAVATNATATASAVSSIGPVYIPPWVQRFNFGNFSNSGFSRQFKDNASISAIFSFSGVNPTWDNAIAVFAGRAASGQGQITAPVGSFVGSGTIDTPNTFSRITQAAVEDLESFSSPTVLVGQIAEEDLETLNFDGPQLVEITQITAEDLETLNFDGPQAVRLSQYVVEILIPFTCDLTPPAAGCILDAVPAAPAGPGCPTPGPDPAAAGSGCKI